MYTSNGTVFGSTATYTCCKESGSRTCGADGLWTSTEPNCQQTGKIQSKKFQELFDFCCLSTELCASSEGHTSVIVVSVIAIIWFVISMVIIVLLSGYIIHMKKKQKQ